MNTQSNRIIPILMLLAGSLLVGFSAGRWLAPLAAWIGPMLIMRSYRDQKVGRGYLLIIVAHILAFLIGFGGMWLRAWGMGLLVGKPGFDSRPFSGAGSLGCLFRRDRA